MATPVEILNRIHAEVFEESPDSTVNVFLCGASPHDSASMRMRINSALEDVPKVSVVFPEWLFATLLSRPGFDLLSLEHELAASVDLIIIPLEGQGTFAELGAFASFDNLRPKMLVINRAVYRSQPSFITRGPVRLVEKYGRDSVFYYYDGHEADVVNDVVTRVKLLRKRQSKSDMHNIFNLARFVTLVVALFQPISETEIDTMLRTWDPKMPRHYVGPCLEILKKRGLVQVSISGAERLFELSQRGHETVHYGLLPFLNRVKVFSGLRSEALESRLKTGWRFDVGRERDRLLAT